MEVIVVGAGITGVAAAEWLRREGHAVTLIDRIEPGDPRQASFGNAGLLARAGVVPVATPGILWHVPRLLLDPDGPLYLRPTRLPRLLPWLLRFLANSRPGRVREISRALAQLTADSVDQHRALARGTGAEQYIRAGPYVAIYPDRAAFEAERFAWELRRAAGFTWEEWDAARLSRHDPALAPRWRFAAALADHGWIDDPGAYVAALAAHFRREGGRFLEGEVVDVGQAEGGRAAVTLAGGARREADRVVLAAGAWSGHLARRLGHEPRLEAERGYHLTLAEPSHAPPAPYMVSAAKLALTPMAMGLRVAGIADFSGLDAPARERAFRTIRRRLAEVYPELRWSAESRWMGQRPTTVDSLPLIGPARRAPAILFAFGGQHLGLTMGARVGRLMADLVAGRRPNIDIRPYRVDRFDAQ